LIPFNPGFLIFSPPEKPIKRYQGYPYKLVEEKGRKAKAFGILTKLERKRRNTLSVANPDSLP